MMKTRFAFLAMLALVASQAAGCIFVVDDDDPEGYFHATWTIDQGATSCADIGAQGVSFLFTDSANDGNDEIFDCEPGMGDTTTMLRDDFTVSVSLLGPGDKPLDYEPAVFDTSLPASDAQCDALDGDLCVVDLPLINFTTN